MTRAKKKNERGGGWEGEEERLPTNSTILKNCVCPRTQLLIVAKDMLGYCERSIHQSDQVSFLLIVLCNNLIGKLTGSMQSCVIRELSWISVDEEPQGELEAEFKFLLRDCNSQALLYFFRSAARAPRTASCQQPNPSLSKP